MSSPHDAENDGLRPPELPNNSLEDLYKSLIPLCRPSADYYILILISTIIATFGLLLNSPAIIIGAMIVAPLMDPILGISLGSLTRNLSFTLRSILTVCVGVALAVALSCAIGWGFSSVGLTEEILGRTRPNIMDLFVALAAGFMGGYAKVRKSMSGSIYGVAIAISLIPPLCVVGLGLSVSKLALSSGASLLFLTNLASIILSGLLSFLLSDIRVLKAAPSALILPAFFVLLLSVPLVLSFSREVRQNQLKKELYAILKAKTYTFEQLNIVALDMDFYKKPVEVVVTVQSVSPDLSAYQVTLVQRYLERRMGLPIHLIVNLMPVLKIQGDSASRLEPEKPLGVSR